MSETIGWIGEDELRVLRSGRPVSTTIMVKPMGARSVPLAIGTETNQRDHRIYDRSIPVCEDVHEAKRELDIIQGFGPGGRGNYAYADGYFGVAMEAKFGRPMEEIRTWVAKTYPEVLTRRHKQ